MRLVFGGLMLVAAACGSVPSDAPDGGGDEDGAAGPDAALTGDDATELDGPALAVPTPYLPIHRLMPLELGRQWTWQVTYDAGTISLGTDCSDGTFVQDTIGVARGPDGLVGVEIDPLCGEAGQKQIYTYNDDGVDYAYAGVWIPFMRNPLAEGSTWASGDGFTSRWNGPNPIGVAAGLFEACWTIVVNDGSSGYVTRQVYCPDVGPVYVEVTDSSGTSIVNAQLLAYARDP